MSFTANDILIDVMQECAEAPLGEFIRFLNERSRWLRNQLNWFHYDTFLTYTATETVAGGSATLGSPTITATAAYFTEALVGRSITITLLSVDYTYTVSSVESTTSLTLTANFAEGTGTVSLTLPIRTDWRLPSNVLNIQTIYATVPTQSNSIPQEYKDPVDYIVWHPSSSVSLIRWQRSFPTVNCQLRYWRTLTAVAAPGDTVDVPDIARDALFWSLMSRLYSRMDVNQYRDRWNEALINRKEALELARGNNNKQRGLRARNAPTTFTL